MSQITGSIGATALECPDPPREFNCVGLGNYLNRSYPTIMRMVARKQLPPPRRLGRELRWTHEQITEWQRSGYPSCA